MLKRFILLQIIYWHSLVFLPIEDTMYKINYSRKNFDDEGEPVGDFYLIGGRCIPCSIKHKIIDED